REQVVHRAVEETLDLSGVQVDGHQPVRPRGAEEVGHQPGRHRLPAAALLVLPCVAEERSDHGDPVRRRPLERVDHDQLLHDPLVDRLGVALDDEGVTTPDRLEEPDEYLAIREVEKRCRGWFDPEVIRDLKSELGECPAGEEHHLLAVCPRAYRHLTCSPTTCAKGPTRAPSPMTADSQTD